MTKYRLSPGANGVEFEGEGTARARGNRKTGAVVEIDDATHRKAIDRAARCGHIHPLGFYPPQVEGWTCECGRDLYLWQETCPRCGETRSEDDNGSKDD